MWTSHWELLIVNYALWTVHCEGPMLALPWVSSSSSALLSNKANIPTAYTSVWRYAVPLISQILGTQLLGEHIAIEQFPILPFVHLSSHFEFAIEFETLESSNFDSSQVEISSCLKTFPKLASMRANFIGDSNLPACTCFSVFECSIVERFGIGKFRFWTLGNCSASRFCWNRDA